MKNYKVITDEQNKIIFTMLNAGRAGGAKSLPMWSCGSDTCLPFSFAELFKKMSGGVIVEGTEKYLPADYSTEELHQVNADLKVLIEKVAEKNKPLAELLVDLMGECVKELFYRLGDNKNREELKKIWKEKHGH